MLITFWYVINLIISFPFNYCYYLTIILVKYFDFLAVICVFFRGASYFNYLFSGKLSYYHFNYWEDIPKHNGYKSNNSDGGEEC